jgi:hypothetical protein
VFKLGSVRTLDIGKRFVRLENAVGHETVELFWLSVSLLSHIGREIAYTSQVALLAEAFKVATAPNKGPELLLDHFVQSFRGCKGK